MLYSPNNAYNTADTFEYGAEWADMTLIRKACEWLKENADMFEAFDPETKTYYMDKNKMIEEFRKAMEE